MFLSTINKNSIKTLISGGVITQILRLNLEQQHLVLRFSPEKQRMCSSPLVIVTPDDITDVKEYEDK